MIQSEKRTGGETLTEFIMPLNPKIKTILEKLCVPHRVYNKTIILDNDASLILTSTLQIKDSSDRIKKHKTVFEKYKRIIKYNFTKKRYDIYWYEDG